MEAEFIWDAEKAKRNLKSVSFETAKQVFFNPYLVILEDCEDDDEIRYQRHRLHRFRAAARRCLRRPFRKGNYPHHFSKGAKPI